MLVVMMEVLIQTIIFHDKESSIRTHNEKLFDLEKVYYKYNNLYKPSVIHSK